MTLTDYLDRLNAHYRTGISTEHTYRADLQNLLEALSPGFFVANEPARISCGAPDYFISRKNIPISQSPFSIKH